MCYTNPRTHSLTHSLTINYTGTDSDKQVIILSNTQKAQNVHQHRQIYPQQQKNGHLLRKSQNYKNLHNQSSVTTVHRLSPSINCYISLICSLLILQVAVSGDYKYPTTLAHARYFINFKMHWEKPPSKFTPSKRGSAPPPHDYLGPPSPQTNGISTGSATLAQLRLWPTHTDSAICNNRPQIWTLSMRFSLVIKWIQINI